LRALKNFKFDSETFSIHNQKTNNSSDIPIFPQFRAIIDKYNGGIPELISEQKLRKYVKEVGFHLPSMHRKIEIQYTRGGIIVREMKFRYELLTLHVARRTLATYLVQKGHPYHQVQLITGHKSLREFENYIRIDPKKTLINMVRSVESDYLKVKSG
jgi:integrase